MDEADGAFERGTHERQAAAGSASGRDSTGTTGWWP
jgi:hypothetical protein